MGMIVFPLRTLDFLLKMQQTSRMLRKVADKYSDVKRNCLGNAE